MENSYEKFIKSIKNKKILFYGLGKSNLPFIQILLKEKINISLYDSRPKEAFSSELIAKLEDNDHLKLYFSNDNIFNNYFDIVIKTPGISFLSEKIQNLRNQNSIITSEMEIFFELCPCKIIAITGSDGKTTTTTIISEILKNSGKIVHLGGNIGSPLLPKIKEIKETDIAVIELSSFQLMSMRKSPDIAVVTNISPNHLDYHKNIEEYISCKKQIIYHQNAFSKAIVNFDNLETRKMAQDVRGKLYFFSTHEKLRNGVWINDKQDIVFSKNGKDEYVLNVSNIKLPGKHNLENYLAAIAATYELSNSENIKKTAETFSGVEHRMEFVRNVNGVSYYNDSIASTPTRTISGAFSLFDKKILLIAGGYDKKISFDSFAKEIIKKVSCLILMGNTSEKIFKEVSKLPNYEKTLKILKVKDMQEAIKQAQLNSNSGDIVVLSPACASFDLYKNFEDRGNHFKSLVNKL